jgi:hypothetical protein
MAYTFTLEDINDYCDKCKSKPCPKPCRFVEEILSYDNRAVMERHTKDGIENFAQRRMIRFTEMDIPNQDVIEDRFDDDIQVPRESRQAIVFFLRFFERLSYKDIAVHIDSTPDIASKFYHAALVRINEILSFLDRKGTAEKLLAKDDGLTETQRMFICKSVMGLTALQISRLYSGKVTPKTIQQRVRNETKKYKAVVCK